MRFFGILIFTILIISSSRCVRNETRSKGRIIGRDAIDGQFPYAVFLEVFFEQYNLICSGSLIGPEWILSSAKCVDRMEYTNVYLGSALKGGGKVSYNVYPWHVIINPYWNIRNGLNDIALINIPKTDICFDVFPVPLDDSNSWHISYEGHMAIASGWNKVSVNLQWERVKIMAKQECDAVHGHALVTNIICTYAELSQCSVQDFGGPLVLEDLGVLIGIHSNSVKHNGACVMIYMRVVSYLLWINNRAI